MELNTINQREFNNLIKEKEKQIVSNVTGVAKEIAVRELKLFEFEMLYSSFIDKEDRNKLEKRITRLNTWAQFWMFSEFYIISWIVIQ